MITIKDVDTELHSILEKKLGSIGFIEIDNRKWVRHRNNGIFDIYSIISSKGASYSPCWGIGVGYLPTYKTNRLIAQHNDKNKDMNLIIDPRDTMGDISDYHYSFLTGVDTTIPAKQIQNCIKRSMELALADFDKVNTLNEFYNYFEYRKKLVYKRFNFMSYINHQLTDALLSFRYNNEQGKIDAFCAKYKIERTNKVLNESLMILSSK